MHKNVYRFLFDSLTILGSFWEPKWSHAGYLDGPKCDLDDLVSQFGFQDAARTPPESIWVDFWSIFDRVLIDF